MRHNKMGPLVIAGFGFMLLLAFGAARQALAQDAGAPYPKMAPVNAYLMPDRAAEIALARSAAPQSISRDATVLVLGRNGYETAVKGSNGFVCMVGRSWSGPLDWPEFWNPKIRAAACLNPQAVRSILPIDELRTRMAVAGRSRAEIVSALRAAFERGQLPVLESGAMSYMMSKSAYLTDQGAHNGPHVMFYTDVRNSRDWGANVAGSPVLASPYWFFSPKEKARMKDLPPMLVFLVGVANWSDGTPTGQHGH